MSDKKKAKSSTYTRPSGWEKTIQRSYWDKDKSYDGEDYKDNEKSNKEKKRKKDSDTAKKGRFGKLLGKLIEG